MTEEKAPPLAPYKRQVFVCTGPRCAPETSLDIYQTLKVKLKELGVDQKSVRRAQAHCFGICQGGPILLVYPEGIWYHHVTHEKLGQIINKHLAGGKPVQEWVFYPQR
ncbi:MAG: (2Fe-2S) ferredoxin domain-containing protein [Candidatus Omnitrophica bacterium]|nr:(2Fe-2S) ferredoxin domain-containing protein [Candidatus Omnitrophota bacterium]